MRYVRTYPQELPAFAELLPKIGTPVTIINGRDDRAAQVANAEFLNERLPNSRLVNFVSSLAHRIAGFPAAGHSFVKDRVNAIALAPTEDFQRDSDLFAEGVRAPEAQELIAAAMQRGLQTPDAELILASVLGKLE